MCIFSKLYKKILPSQFSFSLSLCSSFGEWNKCDWGTVLNEQMYNVTEAQVGPEWSQKYSEVFLSVSYHVGT